MVVYFILIGNILRLTSAIVVVFFEGWGLGKSSERAKILKINRCAATFTRLGGLRGDFKGGVTPQS